jgi:GNAT superfamily N-acetyltransferase
VTTTSSPIDHPPAEAHPELDTLVWQAITTSHARFAEGDVLARRYRPEVAGFAAVRDGSGDAWAALARLAGPGASVLLAGAGPIEPPAGWTMIGRAYGDQMILGGPATRPGHPAIDDRIVALTEDDLAQVLALIELTRPGPFRSRTIELGDYYGVFDGRELVAMAGERLQTLRYTEVSAVCTHPAARGRGLAAALTDHVAARIQARGQVPVLHVAESNHGAKRVYERLGFTDRARIEFVAVRTPDGATGPRAGAA